VRNNNEIHEYVQLQKKKRKKEKKKEGEKKNNVTFTERMKSDGRIKGKGDNTENRRSNKDYQITNISQTAPPRLHDEAYEA